LAVLGNGRAERDRRERMCTRQLRQIIVFDPRRVGGGGEEMRCELDGLERYWVVDCTISQKLGIILRDANGAKEKLSRDDRDRISEQNE
jgi:hypothetical protein